MYRGEYDDERGGVVRIKKGASKGGKRESTCPCGSGRGYWQCCGRRRGVGRGNNHEDDQA